MQDSAVFGVTQQKYIALKYMKMPPRRYVYADLIMRYVPFFLYFLPVLLVAFLLVDGSVWQALGSFVMLFSFRFLGEAVQVWYYEKKERSALCGCSSASPLWEPICRFCCG